MLSLRQLRKQIRMQHLAPEMACIKALIQRANISIELRQRVVRQSAALVKNLRETGEPGLMEAFLAQYGLSTDEGIALMCLAEALLRVPDAATIDELIEDKIAPSSWGEHLGKSSSSLVNTSTWALLLTGKMLDDNGATGVAGLLHTLLKRLGEPLIRTAVKHAMKEMGNQFVLGETIQAAMQRASSMEAQGYSYSYDVLGEAALTAQDAREYFDAYSAAIDALAVHAKSMDIRKNPGISIKLSALHPRYEISQQKRVHNELAQRALTLCLRAKEANIGLNIDAEESARLDLSLDVIHKILSDTRLAGWDGFGVVVQAYSKRADGVIDWLYALAKQLDRKLMVRLVKGAYWDAEIKKAQILGLKDFPVFTHKPVTDVAYICCAKKLLAMGDRIYPQFATHNAHSICAILELADSTSMFEFQRLHGMGEGLHHLVVNKQQTHCRIYAPVGAHRDLLAYLVRRLLENGANSSFVNQILNDSISVEEITADPFDVMSTLSSRIVFPHQLYAPTRLNSRGWDVENRDDLANIATARSQFENYIWKVTPLLAIPSLAQCNQLIYNPATPSDAVVQVVEAVAEDCEAAVAVASDWRDLDAAGRAATLIRGAELYEGNFGELFALLTREAGKTCADAIAELREAVDFLRYYANQAELLGDRLPWGLVVCISPWNFPLAIFTGQIAAALAAGNGVLAKPADPTPAIAARAVQLMHQAGVPRSVLQLLPGAGSVVGAALVADSRVNGVCFTGSTATALEINRSMAEHIAPSAPLIAETGGLNAMIVDSTALPEQATQDIIVSAFQSAGQRCSALRLLYLQEDIAPAFTAMLCGAMDELCIGDPWAFATDVGPVISAAAYAEIRQYIETARREGRLIKQLPAPLTGNFVGPALIQVDSIAELQKEVFGPVLHLATFAAPQVDAVIDQINQSGYGLTFGLHTRIDDRVEQITSRLNVGNMYINRNQIGAVVGSQPFGGEGLSGTGPKAGGPHYLHRLTRTNSEIQASTVAIAAPIMAADVQIALDALSSPQRDRLAVLDLPGPTGESNRLSLYPRGVILCLGPSVEYVEQQAKTAQSQGCQTLSICPGAHGKHAISGWLNRADLSNLHGFDAIVLWAEDADLRAVRKALARRDGPIIPLLCERDFAKACVVERHICIDTTASGGNASLLASV